METENKYLSTEQFAKRLGVSPQYVRSLARNNIVPSVSVGKSWGIPESVLEDNDFVFKYRKDVPDQKTSRDKNKMRYKALSFFSGAMGLDIGIGKAGIEFLLACEFEPNARKTILLNEPDIGLIGNIEEYSVEQIREYAGLSPDDEIDIVVGGPPCQAFSSAGKQLGFEDKRGNVFLTFVDRILGLRPKFAVIENVRGLLSAQYNGGPKGSALAHILSRLRDGGYTVTFNLYNAANYGSPQKRERVVMFCSRDGISVPYLAPTHSEKGEWGLPKWRTVREVFAGIENCPCEHLTFPERRLKYFRLLGPGQYWKDLPEHLHREAMGAKLEMSGGKTGFLRRLAWDEPSPTLVTDPTMPATDLCHPVEDRPLSIEEYKRIQEFPDDWKFFGSTKDKYRQIGNAVPVSLGAAIGRQLVALLEGEVLPKAPEGFPFSRYLNTDDKVFYREFGMEKAGD